MEKISLKNNQTRNPNPKASTNSTNTCPIYTSRNSVSWISDLERVKITAKKTTTPKSLTTVTPIEVWVKGPLALSSFITAIADAGELAIAIVPASMEIEILAARLMPWKKGINEPRK